MRDRLSGKRISETSTEFNNTLRKWATTREIFDVVFVGDLQSEDAQNDGPIKIGLNRIIERNFFTEQKGATFYDHKGIGLNYGKGMALAEMRYVFNKMVDCKDVIELNKEGITNYLYKFINGNSDTEGLVILMSPQNLTTFWGDNEFTHVKNDKSLWGYINHIPMYWSPIITKDKFYIFNKNMGKIIVKTDAHIDISEISPSEYDSIIENIPNMTKDKLKNYVRVKANEVIKFHTREDERTPARVRAMILPEGVMIVEYVKYGGVEKWIILPNSNFLTIFSHLGEETFIRSHESYEPRYTVRITQKKVEIEYFWVHDDKKVISLTNQDVRKIQDNLGKTGKLLYLDVRTRAHWK